MVESRGAAGQGPFRAGDLIWVDFDPQAGSEQARRRPALVLSEDGYNRRSRLIVCCPITKQLKGYPFEVEMPPASAASGGLTGAVLVDHVRSIDWRQRRAERAGTADPALIEEVRLALAALLDIPE